MSAPDTVDLSACGLWRPSAPLGAVRVGIIPAWNAVTLLNPTAATIWDLLIDTRDAAATARGYARRHPDRIDWAQADVSACLVAWDRQGFLRPPEPPQEALLLEKVRHDRPRPAGSPRFRRTFAVGGIATRLEVEDPALGAVVADLLVDFPDTDQPPQHVLRASCANGIRVLDIDADPVRVAETLPLARGQIVAELVRLAGGETGWRATVHGAVLAGPSGPVFLAGDSGAGKSTLSAGLVALGWRILAEDLAAFGPGWAVCPLPFALSIKDGAVETLSRDYPGLDTARVHRLGPRNVRYQGVPPQARAQHPARPRMFLDVKFSAEMADSDAEMQRLSDIETLGLFMNEESYIGFERDDTGDFLDFIAQTPAYRIRYGTVAAAERGIRSQLDRHRCDDLP